MEKEFNDLGVWMDWDDPYMTLDPQYMESAWWTLKKANEQNLLIINEVLRIYAAQGQDVADKHLEIIVRQMFSRVQIEDAGDSDFVTGDIVSKAAVVNTNKQLAAEGKNLISYTQLLLGITKVSIWSDSWLSAASFQDTTRVLINAAAL